MPRAPETFANRLTRGFWKIWEKAWVVIFFVFLGLNLLAAYRWGWPSLIRAWGAIFAFIGLATIISYWRGTNRARQSLSWVPVEARILDSRVMEERRSSSSGRPSDSMTYYFPEVEYEYDYQGLTYTSDRIIFLKVNYGSSEAAATVARYPAGARVPAFVDPGNPRVAVLEPGLEGKRGKYAIAAIVGTGFLIMGVAVWLLFGGARF